jgi:Kef-type K+ transport system membrane component KefB
MRPCPARLARRFESTKLAPVTEAVDLSLYKEALLFLATAGVVAPLFFRLRISPVLGYLLAGVALGPYGLGSLAGKAHWLSAFAINVESIDRLAAFGVVALLFTMGLELSLERLRRMRRFVFGLGLSQVVVTLLILTAIGWGLGLKPAAALAIGGALAMSSTAIVIPVLIEGKRLGAPVGRASFAVLLFQDLAVAPLLVTAISIRRIAKVYAAETATRVPVSTAPRRFTSPIACAQMLHGLARRISPGADMGVRPKPMAMA